MKPSFLIVFIFCWILDCSLSIGQVTGWTLQSEKEGIKLFRKPTAKDGTLQIRLVARTPATIEGTLRTYQDMNTVKERILNSKSIEVLAKKSDNDVYYRLISDWPWPLKDRDVIMHQVIRQNILSKIIMVDAYAAPDYLPKDKNYIRIQKWETHSISTPKSDGTVEVDYRTIFHPAGNIPSALIESTVEEITIKGMKKLLQLTQSSAYR